MSSFSSLVAWRSPGADQMIELALSFLFCVITELGIKYHEDGELERSAWYFEQSAKGGSGGGMLMYGLALRHGWVRLLRFAMAVGFSLTYFMLPGL